MIRSKKIYLYILFLFVIFMVRWWFLNRDMFPVTDKGGIEGILSDIASSYNGYNDMYIHASAYTLFFLLLLNLSLPEWEIQVLVRMPKVRYIGGQFVKIVLASAAFTAVFLSVAVICTTFTAGAGALGEWGYYRALIPMFTLTFMYYLMMGAVFMFLYVALGTKTKAVFASYAVSVIMLGIHIFHKSLWIPVYRLDVVDKMLDGQFRMAEAVLDVVKLSGICLFLCFFATYIFKGKDILGENG